MNTTSKIKYLSAVGAMALAAAFTSCEESNDWDTDSSYARLFSVTKLSVTAEATEAEVTFGKIPGTEYYIIQVSEDTMANDIEPQIQMTFGADGSITSSPYTLTDLNSTTRYFLRIKACSDATADSRWTYLESVTFKTKSEQLMLPLGGADKTSGTAHVSWTPGAAMTQIVLLDDKGSELRRIDLTADDVAAGEYTFEGLDPLTTYTVEIYNHAVRRGYVTFSTYAEAPAADYIAYISATDSVNYDLLQSFVDEGYKSVTVAMPGDAVFHNPNRLLIPDGLSVTFFGLPGNERSVLAVNGINLGGTHAYVKFENLTIDGAVYEDGVATATNNNYVFNQSEPATVGTIEFRSCVIINLKNTVFRLQGSDSKVVNSLVFDDCIYYGPATRTYSFVHVDAGGGAGKVENISISNCTVVHSGKCLVYSKNTDFTKLIISNCTVFDAPGAGDYILDCASTSYGPTEGATLSNCIFGYDTSTTVKGMRCSGTPVVENCYATTEFVQGGNKVDLEDAGAAQDVFKCIDEGSWDFTFADPLFKGQGVVGDPRWFVSE